MTPSATSGRHLSMFEKENAVSDGFGSNFSGAAFCLPINWWALCQMSAEGPRIPAEAIVCGKLYNTSGPAEAKLGRQRLTVWLVVPRHVWWQRTQRSLTGLVSYVDKRAKVCGGTEEY